MVTTRRIAVFLVAVTKRKLDKAIGHPYLQVVCKVNFPSGHFLTQETHHLQLVSEFSTNCTNRIDSKVGRSSEVSCNHESSSERIVVPQDIASINRLLNDAVKKKDGCLYMFLMEAKVKQLWNSGKRADALKCLKDLYDLNYNKFLGKKEIKSARRRIFKSLLGCENDASSCDELSEFATWAGQSKNDWKLMALLWLSHLHSKDALVQQKGIQLFKAHSEDFDRYVPKRISSCADFSPFSEDTLSHLLDVAVKHSVHSVLSHICEELMKKLSKEGKIQVANELLKLAASESIAVSPVAMDAYVSLLKNSNSVVPSDGIASRFGTVDESEACSDKEKTHIELKSALELSSVLSERTCLSFENCLRLLRPLAEHGCIENVQKVLKVARNIHPRQFAKEGELKRYLAEALWKNGQISEAIACIKSECEKYRAKKRVVRLLRNVFCICSVKTSTFSDEEVVKAAKWFGSEMGDFKALAVVWRHLIASESFEHYQIGELLFEQYANDMRNEIPQVMNDVVKSPPSQEALRRFIEAALKLDLRSFVSQLYSVLLDSLCDSDNIILADEVFNSAAGLGINIEQRSLRRYLTLRRSSLDIVAPYAKKKPVGHTAPFQLKF